LIVLFVLIALLIAVEASTSLSRLSGYIIKCPEGGLILQSSLALLSRMVMFLFMPFLGYLSDTGGLGKSKIELIALFSLFPLALFLVFYLRKQFVYLYINLITRINEHGSFFNTGISLFRKSGTYSLTARNLRPLKSFYRLAFFAYLPYYLAWPMIIFLLNEFSEYRGLILGLTSVFNGINTIILTLFIDPRLIKLGKYKSLLSPIYSHLVLIRFYSSVVSLLLFTLFILAYLGLV